MIQRTKIYIILLLLCLSLGADEINVNSANKLSLKNASSEPLKVKLNIDGIHIGNAIIDAGRSKIFFETGPLSAGFKSRLCGGGIVGGVCVAPKEISVNGGEVIRVMYVTDDRGEFEKVCAGVGLEKSPGAKLSGDVLLCLDKSNNLSLLAEATAGAGISGTGFIELEICKLSSIEYRDYRHETRTDLAPEVNWEISITYPTENTSQWNGIVMGTSNYIGGTVKVYIRTDRNYLQGETVVKPDCSWQIKKAWPTKGTQNVIYAELYNRNKKKVATSNKIKIYP